MSKYFFYLMVFGLLPTFNTTCIAQSKKIKPRTIITTDGEIDDVDTYIRMLLYANEFSIEGLIYSSSQWHYKGDGKGTKFTSEIAPTKELYGERTSLRWPGVTWMQDLLGAYEKIYPNLTKHASDYPSPSYLRSLIRIGNIDFEGEMDKITEGSEFIKNKLLDNTAEPLYLQAWGGTNTIARALKSIEEQYKGSKEWKNVYHKICTKAIIYAILDQDATYRKYVSVMWPDLKIYYNSNQFWCFAYPWPQSVPEPIQPYLQGQFMSKNILLDHGPLLKMYYSYGDGQKQAGDEEHIHGDVQKQNEKWKTNFKKYDFISEGDSPAFLHLVDVGLGNLSNPHFGGWGGRLIQSSAQPNRWEDGENAADFNPYTNKMDKTYPQTRWVETLQNDFAARADWCISDYKNANHAPVVKLKHKNKLIGIQNKMIHLKASAKDPDGQKLSYKWWQYSEVDTYQGEVMIKNADGPNASIVVPSDLKTGETIHIIVEVRDNHPLPMTRYQRVIITGK